MRKFKIWLVNKYLPAWCREELLTENDRLNKEVKKQAAKIDSLNAYIDGMKDAIRRRPLISFFGGGLLELSKRMDQRKSDT